MNARSPLFRLVAFYCALLLVLGAAFALFTIRSFERYANETIAREVRARSQEIWDTSKGSLDRPHELAALLETRFAPEAQGHFIRLAEGSRIIYQSSFPGGGESGTASFGTGNPSLSASTSAHLILDRRTYTLAAGRRIEITSGQSDDFARTVERSLTDSLLFGLPILLVLAALGGYVVMRRSLKPVEVMIDAAEAITFNDPGNRLPLAHTGDRIEALGLALNRMLDRLDHAYQYANRFSTDAAHELRTPLAIIRGELEFIAGNELSVELRGSLQNVLDEVIRLSEMVDNLGILSRMESLWGKHAHSEFDLHALARDTMEQMRLLAEEKNIELSQVAGGPTMVAGDKNRLKQLLVNLLDNAVKYTAPGGRIDVEAKPLGMLAQLSVRDTGIGIAAEHREKIFDRFYRVSTDRGETGSGLGLSIVKSICSAHGGRVAVESAPGAGTIFRVELPLAALSARNAD